MALAIFDLDETLIGTDSDQAWGEYVLEKQLVDAPSHLAKNQQFYEDYKRGELDADAYYQFSCGILAQHDMDLLLRHRDTFVRDIISPTILSKARELLNSHQAKHDTLVIVTATIEFITRPIADMLGVEHLIAPVPEVVNGQHTGQLVGIPSLGPGKVTRLAEWVEERALSMADSTFYSDSHNDIPLLEVVDHPVAVDPDPQLAEIARQRAWRVISLRD